jgi:hypothetical protein
MAQPYGEQKIVKTCENMAEAITRYGHNTIRMTTMMMMMMMMMMMNKSTV